MKGWSCLSWWRRLESCLCSQAWRVCMVHSYVCLLIYTTQSMCLSAWDSYYCVVFSRNDLMMNWPHTPPIMIIYYSTCFYQEKLGHLFAPNELYLKHFVGVIQRQVFCIPLIYWHWSHPSWLFTSQHVSSWKSWVTIVGGN